MTPLRNRTRRFALLVGVAVALAAPVAARAAYGDLDPSFGSGGLAAGAVQPTVQAAGVAVAPDDKIVVVGPTPTTDGTSGFGVVRYNADGTLDSTFDGDGRVATSFGSRLSAEATAVAVQPDGKIVVAGWTNSLAGNAVGLVRYEPDGSLDPAFGSGGKVTTLFSRTTDGRDGDAAYDVALQADGKIVVLAATARYGSSWSFRRFAFARYLPNGVLDPSFGLGGTTVVGQANENHSPAGVAVGPDGRIAAAGYADGDFLVMRLTAGGVLDTTFDGDGIATTDLGGARDEASSVAVQRDGKIVVGGSSSDARFALVRYTASGSPDPSFGDGGKVLTGFDNDRGALLKDIVAAGGKIIAGGSTILPLPGTAAFALAKYTSDGRLDSSFGSGGKVRTALAGSAQIRGLALQSDGRIVAAGSAPGGFAVARYLDDSLPPVVDCGRGSTGWFGDNAVVQCSAVDRGSGLADPGDRFFELTTSVPPGTEDQNASTNSRVICDNAGNCTTAGPIIGIAVDRKPPEYICARPDGVWHAANLTFDCSATDTGVGLATSADAAFTVATAVPAGVESADAAAERMVCDALHNCTDAKVAGNKIDRRAPDASIDPIPNYVLNAASAPVGRSCQDGGSGVASCAVSTIDTSSVGRKAVSATASDAVGNSRTVTQSYTVVYDVVQAELGLVQLVDARGVNVSSPAIGLSVLGHLDWYFAYVGGLRGPGYQFHDRWLDWCAMHKSDPDCDVVNGQGSTDCCVPPSYYAVVQFTAGGDPTVHEVVIGSPPGDPETARSLKRHAAQANLRAPRAAPLSPGRAGGPASRAAPRR